MASSSSASSSRPDPAFSTLAALQSTFVLRPQTRNYNHQYANMYFARLVQLRQAVLERAEKKWGQAAGEFFSLRRWWEDVEGEQRCRTLSCCPLDATRIESI